MEIIIAIFFFSICAAVCVSISAKAAVTAERSGRLNDAVICASNLAEVYRAAGGDTEKTALMYDGNFGSVTTAGEGELTAVCEDMTVVLKKEQDGAAAVTVYCADAAGKSEIYTLTVRAEENP